MEIERLLTAAFIALLITNICLVITVAGGVIVMTTGVKHTTTGNGTFVNNTVWSESHTYDASANTSNPMQLVWKDSKTNVLNLDNQASSVGWTDIDCTAATSANAQIVYLQLKITVDTANEDYLLSVRKKGTTDVQSLWLGAEEAHAGDTYYAQLFVGMDSDETIQYYISMTGSGQADYDIDVFAYWE